MKKTPRFDRRTFLAGAGAAGVAGLLPAHLLAAEPSNRPVLFRGAAIFDGRSPGLISGQDVLVENGMIAAIGENLAAPDGARTIDADGRVLMPGMMDMHWHSLFATMPQAAVFSADFGYITLNGAQANYDALMRGFTTVRDVGGNVFPIYRATNEGLIKGPRIYPSGGYLSQTSGHGDFRPATAVPAPPWGKYDYFAMTGNSLIADGVPECMQRTREVLRMGATQIKVMAGGGVSSFFDPIDVTQYTFDEMRAIVEVAGDWNTYVTVHAFGDASIAQAIEAGVQCIEHANLLTDDVLQMVVDKGVWLSLEPILDDEDAIFPEGSPALQRGKFVQVAEGTDRVYSRVTEMGIKTAFGTDTLFDPALAAKQGKQLAKLVRWFEPHKALAQAMFDAGELAKLCGPRDPYPGALGVVAEGAHADLILVNGDPLADIDLIADPDNNFAMIMKGGEAVKDQLA